MWRAMVGDLSGVSRFIGPSPSHGGPPAAWRAGSEDAFEGDPLTKQMFIVVT